MIRGKEGEQFPLVVIKYMHIVCICIHVYMHTHLFSLQTEHPGPLGV